MMDPRAFDVFMEIHRGLPRQGPGSAQITRRAFTLLREAAGSHARTLDDPALRLLDVGCGPGAQTLELAALTGGRIVAVDLHDPFLRELRERATQAGVAARVDLVRADMTRLPLARESFDLLWSEGAIYIAGFEKGLRELRPLLRSAGLAAVSEATWLRSEAPEELRRFWNEGYPAMKDVPGNLEVITACGYEVLGHFTLPESCWWEYYGPIEARLDGWLERRGSDDVVRACVEAERAEIDLYRRFSSFYGYVFYLMRKA